MTASCYLCLKGHTRPIPGSSLGDAEATCRTCGILACAGHGFRDRTVPAYYCVLCKVAALTVAGATTGGGGTPDIAPLLPGEDSAVRVAASAIRSARAEFQSPQAEPNWPWVLAEAESFASMPASALAGSNIERWWARLPEEGRLLVGCALAIVDRLELPSEDVLPLLQLMMTGVARA
jgi:hypothetical protein